MNQNVSKITFFLVKRKCVCMCAQKACGKSVEVKPRVKMTTNQVT